MFNQYSQCIWEKFVENFTVGIFFLQQNFYYVDKPKIPVCSTRNVLLQNLIALEIFTRIM